MDFQQRLESNLNRNCINRARRLKYKNVSQMKHIEKLKYLNTKLGITLETISSYLNNTPASINHWLKFRNNIPDHKVSQIDSLFKYSISTLNRLTDKNKDCLSTSDVTIINDLILEGNKLLENKVVTTTSNNNIFIGGH